MGSFAIFAGIMVLLTVAAMWFTKIVARAQTSKSIGELLNDEKKANDDLQIRNEVLSSDPDTANRRLQDKWTRPE